MDSEDELITVNLDVPSLLVHHVFAFLCNHMFPTIKDMLINRKTKNSVSSSSNYPNLLATRNRKRGTAVQSFPRR